MGETMGASPEAIQFHYDVSNEFYRLWLDSSMTYTAALFSEGETEEDLHGAQLRKIDYFAERLGIKPGARVLDVGCGWGAMLRRFIGHHGASDAVGVTLSEKQRAWIEQDPLPQLEVRLEDWKDHQPAKPYDAIVSIEAMEAFVSPGLTEQKRIDIYRDFFSRCHTWLRPGGKLGIQVIAYGNSGPEDLDQFISSSIFPQSDLPRLAELAAAIERRFEIRTLVNEREHYVRTLRAWLRNLTRNREEAIGQVGEDTVRRYDEYLRLCTYIFASGSCDLYRIVFQRIDFPRVPRNSMA